MCSVVGYTVALYSMVRGRPFSYLQLCCIAIVTYYCNSQPTFSRTSFLFSQIGTSLVSGLTLPPLSIPETPSPVYRALTQEVRRCSAQ